MIRRQKFCHSFIPKSWKVSSASRCYDEQSWAKFWENLSKLVSLAKGFPLLIACGLQGWMETQMCFRVGIVRSSQGVVKCSNRERSCKRKKKPSESSETCKCESGKLWLTPAYQLVLSFSCNLFIWLRKTRKSWRKNSTGKLTYLILFYWSRKAHTAKTFSPVNYSSRLLLCSTRWITHEEHENFRQTLSANCQFVAREISIFN